MDAAFARYFRPTRGAERHELLVCHGNIIRYLVRRALGDVEHRWWRADIQHTGLSIVGVDGAGEMRLLALDDVGHLRRAHHTFL